MEMVRAGAAATTHPAQLAPRLEHHAGTHRNRLQVGIEALPAVAVVHNHSQAVAVDGVNPGHLASHHRQHRCSRRAD